MKRQDTVREEPVLEYEHGQTAGVLYRPIAGFKLRSDLAAVELLERGDTPPAEPWLWMPDPAMEAYAVYRIPSLLGVFDRLAGDVEEIAGSNLGAPRKEELVASRVLPVADRLGPLDKMVSVVETGLSRATVLHAERLDMWVQALATFAELRLLARAIGDDSQSDRELLRSRIRWQGGVVIYRRRLRRGHHLSVISNPRISAYAEVSRQLQTGDYRGAARYYVCREINARLRGVVSPAVLPFAGLRIRYFPSTLLSAVYLEFAREMAGKTPEKLERECASPVCTQTFFQNRRDQRFCSNPCRSLSGYYKRSALARRSRGYARVVPPSSRAGRHSHG